MTTTSPPRAALQAFCAGALALDDDAAHHLAEQVRDYLARMPSREQTAARAGFAMLDLAAVPIAGRRLRGLSADTRQRVLASLASRPQLGAAIDGLKATVMLVHASSATDDQLRARAQAHLPARPDPELDVTPASAWPTCTTADVVVVGSGAGGAMAARTLARAGLQTVVVEEGRRHTVEEFRTRPGIDRLTDLYRDAAARFAIGRTPILLPVGRGVGGTTLVNSGTCYRTPDRVLRRWHGAAGVEFAAADRFAAYLDEVERTIGVAPVDLRVMGPNGRIAMDGARALGWSSHPLARNADACVGTGQCALGCPRNAKLGVHLTALPQACEAGARIVSEATVERLLHDRGRAAGVVVRRRDGTTLEILAPRVVVAAGATETPLLLRRSGLDGHHELGRNLALHPATGVAGRFAHTVTAWNGVLQSVGVDEFHEREGILIEATATPPGMGSAVLPGLGRELAAEVEGADRLAFLGAMVADDPAGRVLGHRRALIRYDLRDRDARRLLQAIEAMGRMLFAAGAHEVLTGIPGRMRVATPSELEDAVRGADGHRLHVAAFHPSGTARMGADSQSAAVDASGRLRGIDGVWVADASALPSSPHVNPQVSIMALALAVADELLRGEGEPPGVDG